MTYLWDIVARLEPYRSSQPHLTFAQLTLFMDLACRMVPLIRLVAPRTTQGLPRLPTNVRALLSSTAVLPLGDIDVLWNALGPILMAGTPPMLPSTTLEHRVSVIAPYHQLGMLPASLS